MTTRLTCGAFRQYSGNASSTSSIPGLKDTNLKGPAHTGRVPNLSPSSRAAFGETIMPERSVNAAISGTSGSARLKRTVRSLTMSTVLISPISLLRNEPGVDRCRSMLNRTASA